MEIIYRQNGKWQNGKARSKIIQTKEKEIQVGTEEDGINENRTTCEK